MPYSIGGLQGLTELSLLCLTFLTSKLPGTAAGRPNRPLIHTHRQQSKQALLVAVASAGIRPGGPAGGKPIRLKCGERPFAMSDHGAVPVAG
jgi:hypothetical protein